MEKPKGTKPIDDVLVIVDHSPFGAYLQARALGLIDRKGEPVVTIDSPTRHELQPPLPYNPQLHKQLPPRPANAGPNWERNQRKKKNKRR